MAPDFSALIRMVTADLQAGHLPEAEAKLRLLLEEQPTHAGVLEQLALVRFQIGDATEAVDLLRQAIAAGAGGESVWNNLGVILESLGRMEEAARSYRRALQANPSGAILHYNLGNALRALGAWPEAEEAYRRCMALAPQHADARHNLGVLRQEQGASEEAVHLFQATLTLAPGMVDAHVNLGSSLQALGRDAEALASYREALLLVPGYADAAAGEATVLDRLGRVIEAAERIEQAFRQSPDQPDVIITFASLAPRLRQERIARVALESLLQRPDLATRKKEAALFALGKLYDQEGFWEQAFSSYQQAHTVRPRAFDLNAFLDFGRRTREIFSAENRQRLPKSGSSSSVPIFVVGMPRSGTSLVEQILASHSQVHGAGELTWVDDLAAAWPTRLGASLPYPECALDFSVRSLDGAASEYLSHLRDSAPSATRIVDKMPGNFTHLGLIALLFPQARIIHIRRDPLDTCLSCYFQNFRQGHEYTGDLSTLGQVYREYERLMAHWHQVLTMPLLEVSYEELVTDQERQSRRLIEFCGLPWEEQCLRFHESKRTVHTASYDQVRRPMYQKSIGRHRPYLPYLRPLQAGLESR